jgi:hypothetical protein
MIPVKYKTQQKDRKKKETSKTGSEIYKSDNNLPPPLTSKILATNMQNNLIIIQSPF